MDGHLVHCPAPAYLNFIALVDWIVCAGSECTSHLAPLLIHSSWLQVQAVTTSNTYGQQSNFIFA